MLQLVKLVLCGERRMIKQLCFLILCFLVWYFLGLTTELVQANSSSSPIYYPKVYILIFNPVLKTKGNQKLIEYKKWFDPSVLISQTVNALNEVSYGMINYQIAGKIEIDDIPIKQDGFDYTEKGYLDCIEGRGSCHNQPWTVDYANYRKILADYQICEKANRNEVDEIWLFGGPWFGFYEANMAGVGAFPTNGPIIEDTTCQRAIHIMGYSYERSGEFVLEDFGHRTEGTLNHYLGSKTNSTGYGLSQFISNIGHNPSQQVFGCGNIHYPPNAFSDYQYENQNYVKSNCDDWLNYPNFQNDTKEINCYAWGCTNAGYFKWWFKHLPHIDGVDSNGNYNNWWKYITNAAAVKPTITTSPVLASPSSSPAITVSLIPPITSIVIPLIVTQTPYNGFPSMIEEAQQNKKTTTNVIQLLFLMLTLILIISLTIYLHKNKFLKLIYLLINVIKQWQKRS